MEIRYSHNTAGYCLMYFAREYSRRMALSSYDDYRCRRYTYTQLLEFSIQTAGLLLDKGCNKGDAVMVCAPDSGEYATLIFAAAILGLRMVPVDYNTSIGSLKKIHKATIPRCVFTARPDLMAWLEAENGNVADIAHLREDVAPYPRSHAELMASRPGTSYYVDDNDVYVVIFTSGTTSEPKAVSLTHRNLMSNVANFRHMCFVPENDQVLSMAPLSHALGLTLGLYCILSYGAALVYVEKLTSQNIMRVVHRDRIKGVLTVPAFLNVLKDKIEQALEEQGKLEAVRRAIPRMLRVPVWVRRRVFRKILAKLGGDLEWVATGASALNVEVGNFWEAMGIKVCQGYGLSECLIVSISDFEWRRMGTVGRCLPGQDVRVDERGEIWVAGPTVFTGYDGHPELNAEIFRDGWYRTGDIGTIDPDGHIRIVGRAKNVIIGPSGLNIYPEDIESVVCALPEVQDCVVVNNCPGGSDVYLVLQRQLGVAT